MNGSRVAVVGATGAVGQVLLRLFEERAFPARSIRLCGSERSRGKMVRANGTELAVERATSELFAEVDLVFIAARGEVSRALAPMAVEQGATVIDKSSAYRMDPAVPLVVPEVNGDDLDAQQGIVASPNCSTTPLVMALKALEALAPVSRVVVDTYQSVSGSGVAAMDELRAQSADVLAGRSAEPREYPHRIAFNALPQIDDFQDNGYTGEEIKMVDETRKILHRPGLAVSATCVRVPVMVGHSEAVHVEFARPVDPADAREALAAAPGIRVLDDPRAGVYPMPVDAEGRDEVFAGRVRRDASHPNGIAMWLVSDNLRKGAALNAVQIAEELLKRELVPAATGRR